jgi:hypothetical protein
MPRVVPSQVVDFIDQVFPWLRAPGQGGYLSREHSGEAAGLLSLVDRIPEELLTLAGSEYGEFVCSVSAIRDKLVLWQNQQNPNIPTYLGQSFRGLNPVTLIRQALAKCPDEGPAPSTSELAFVTDAGLRTNLRNDVGAINRALANGEWKAATVLSGSAIEALLLWALEQRPPSDIATAIAALTTSGELTRQPNANLERWDLHEFTEVAAKLEIIKADAAIETRLAREFRNLIHPGRAQRLGQKCDRGTALSSVAALDHVVRDLS